MFYVFHSVHSNACGLITVKLDPKCFFEKPEIFLPSWLTVAYLFLHKMDSEKPSDYRMISFFRSHYSLELDISNIIFSRTCARPAMNLKKSSSPLPRDPRWITFLYVVLPCRTLSLEWNHPQVAAFLSLRPAPAAPPPCARGQKGSF